MRLKRIIIFCSLFGVIFSFFFFKSKNIPPTLLSQTNGVCLNNFSVIHSEKSKINFKKLTISPRFVYKKPITVLNMVDEERNYYCVWKINEEYKIKHYSFKSWTLEKYKRDLVEILGKKFCLVDICKQFGYRYPIIMDSFIFEIYEFEFSEKKYLLFLIDDEDGSGTHYFLWAILFDITDTNNITPIIVGDGEYIETRGSGSVLRTFPDYLGDFDEDGVLDYANWRFSKDKVSIYHLHDNKFVIDKSKYLAVKSIIPREKYLINQEKSNWFFPIDNSKKAKCKLELNFPDYSKPLYIWKDN